MKMTNRQSAAMDRWITGNYGEDSVQHGPPVCRIATEGSQWEVWVRQYPDARWVAWDCPVCDVENVDSPDLTHTPICGNCDLALDWWDLDCLESD